MSGGFRYTLSSEGSTDQMLMPVINWVVEQNSELPYSGVWANPSVFDDKSKDCKTRILQAVNYYPSELIVVHRDVDGATYDVRVKEIRDAAAEAGVVAQVIPIVPERMTEAWFLFDEPAIRLAAGSPGGTAVLSLPNHAAAQRRADPKEILDRAILDASGASGRKLASLRREIVDRRQLVSERIMDFSPLRNHASFRAFEGEMREFLRSFSEIS